MTCRNTEGENQKRAALAAGADEGIHSTSGNDLKIFPSKQTGTAVHLVLPFCLYSLENENILSCNRGKPKPSFLFILVCESSHVSLMDLYLNILLD